MPSKALRNALNAAKTPEFSIEDIAPGQAVVFDLASGKFKGQTISGGSGGSGGTPISIVSGKPSDSFGSVGDLAMTLDGRTFKKKIASMPWEDFKPGASPFPCIPLRGSTYGDYAGSVTFSKLPTAMDPWFRATIWEDDAFSGAVISADCSELGTADFINFSVSGGKWDNAFSWPDAHPQNQYAETNEYRNTSVTFPGFGSVVLSEGNGGENTGQVGYLAVWDNAQANELRIPDKVIDLPLIDTGFLTLTGDPAVPAIGRNDPAVVQLSNKVLLCTVMLRDNNANDGYMYLAVVDWTACVNIINDTPTISVLVVPISDDGGYYDPFPVRLTDARACVMCRAINDSVGTTYEKNYIKGTDAFPEGTDTGRKFVTVSYVGGVLSLVQAFNGQAIPYSSVPSRIQDAWVAMSEGNSLNIYSGGGQSFGMVSDTKAAFMYEVQFDFPSYSRKNVYAIQVWDVMTGTLLNSKYDLFVGDGSIYLDYDSSSLWSGCVMENGAGFWMLDLQMQGWNGYGAPIMVPVKIDQSTNVITTSEPINCGMTVEKGQVGWSDYNFHKIPEIDGGLLNGWYWQHTDDDADIWIFKDTTKVGVATWVEMIGPNNYVRVGGGDIAMTDNRTAGAGGTTTLNPRAGDEANATIIPTGNADIYVRAISEENFRKTVHLVIDWSLMSSVPLTEYVAPFLALTFANSFDSSNQEHKGEWIDFTIQSVNGMPDFMKFGQGDASKRGSNGWQTNLYADMVADGNFFFNNNVNPLHYTEYIDWFKLARDPRAYVTVRVGPIAGRGWCWWVTGESEAKPAALTVTKEPISGKYHCPLTRSPLDYHILIGEAGAQSVEFPMDAHYAAYPGFSRNLFIHTNNNPQDVSFMANGSGATLSITSNYTEVRMDNLMGACSFKIVSSMA